MTTHATTSGQDSLARTVLALQAVKRCAAARRGGSRSGNLGIDPNHPGLTTQMSQWSATVVSTSRRAFGKPLSACTRRDPNLWTGDSTDANSYERPNHCEYQKTAQQALLNWETFNVGKRPNCFDQTAGGANASEWIVFNTLPTLRRHLRFSDLSMHWVRLTSESERNPF